MNQLLRVNNIYKNSSNLSIDTFHVYHFEFDEFRNSFTNLRTLIGKENLETDIWDSKLKPISYFIGRQKKFPLAFNNDYSRNNYEEFQRQVKDINRDYPHYEKEIR